jgi:hypothetical protein
MTSPCGPRRQPWRLKWDRLGQFRAFLDEGIWHIRKGYDHILFLLTLLLPAVAVLIGLLATYWLAVRAMGFTLR